MSLERLNKKRVLSEEDCSHNQASKKTKIAVNDSALNNESFQKEPSGSPETFKSGKKDSTPRKAGYEYLIGVMGDDLQDGRLVSERFNAPLKELADIAKQINEMSNIRSPLLLKQSLQVVIPYASSQSLAKEDINYDTLKIGEKHFVFHPKVLSEKFFNGPLSGPCRIVHPIQDLDSGQFGTVKIYNKEASNDVSLMQRIIVEKTVLEKMGRLMGYFHDDATGQIYLVSQFVPGNSLQCLLQNKNFNTAEKIDVAGKIVDAVIDFHEKCHFLHCDLNLNNIVFNPATGEVALIDFDVSLEMGQGVDQGSVEPGTAKTKECRGTPGFIAPEAMKNYPHVFNEKTEVYALGKTFKEWLELGKFRDISADGPFSFFVKQSSPEEKAQHSLMSAYVDRMIANNPDERPSLKEIKAELSIWINETVLHNRLTT